MLYGQIRGVYIDFEEHGTFHAVLYQLQCY
jgi:hypothetical protein